MSVQVEGIYTKVLLYTGAQVALVYWYFYNKHLKHIPLCKLEELEIRGIGSNKFPYNGYIPIKNTFGPSVAGKTETFNMLALVCHQPPGAWTKLNADWDQ